MPAPAVAVAERPPITRREWAALAALTLFGLVLRVYALGSAALWVDEMCFIIYLVGLDTNPFEAFLRHWDSIVSIGHMPLPGALQNAYFNLLGFLGVTDIVHRPWLNRLPMAIVGSSAIPGVYFAARALFGRGPVAWCAAIFMASALYPVYYSREAYCYAYAICFGSWGLVAWTNLYSRGGRAHFIGAVAAFTAMALSHLGAVVVVAAATAVAGLLWFGSLMREPLAQERANRLLATIAPGIAFVAAAPFLVKFMLYNTAHIGSGHAPLIWMVWNDAVNKMFLGEKPVLAAIAWLVWLIGMVSLAARGRHDRTNAGPLVAMSLALGIVLLGIATTRSQYISARYFSPLAPSMYLVFAAGLGSIAGALVARGSFRPTIRSDLAAIGLTTVAVIPHLFYFLPLYWRLPDRGEPFERVATWMANNLPPGTPYILQYAHQGRWIGQFYPTPTLAALSPYLQDGQREEDILRRKQRQTCERIPETVYVRSCGINGTVSDPPWAWPESHFHNRVCIENPELRRLIRSGIFPGVPYEHVDDRDYDIDIFFDRPADRIAAARRSGEGIVFEFPDWVVAGQQVSAQEILYFRLPGDARRAFSLENVTDQTVAGTVEVDFVVVGPAGGASDVKLVLDDVEGSSLNAALGNLHRLTLATPDLRPGKHEIHIQVSSGDGAARTVGLWDVRWAKAAKNADRPAADAAATP